MNLRLIFACLVGFLPTIALANESHTTASELEAQCIDLFRDGSTSGGAACNQYMNGFNNGLQVGEIVARNRKNRALFCGFYGAGLSSHDLARIYLRGLEQHPEWRPGEAGLALGLILTEAFPCNK